ncbi:hypothetical protein C8F01DRAFT_674902 [Mycena amicta]|nr:hypothetical protein C8F01DRAFT_674902 [Mycena amicta]
MNASCCGILGPSSGGLVFHASRRRDDELDGCVVCPDGWPAGAISTSLTAPSRTLSKVVAKNGFKHGGRSVKVLSGLFVEYAVPFPIAYVFPLRVLQAYGEVFVFLLQIWRSKERILARGARIGIELKVFYVFRSRLSWFIKCVFSRVLLQPGLICVLC